MGALPPAPRFIAFVFQGEWCCGTIKKERHPAASLSLQLSQTAQVAPQRCPILSVSKSILSVAPLHKLCQCQIYATQVSSFSDASVQQERLSVSNVTDIFNIC